MNSLEKLSIDSIASVMLEIRFEHQQELLPEVVVADLTEHYLAKGFTHTRLAEAEIPFEIRENTPTLKYKPIVKLTNPDDSFHVTIGPHDYGLFLNAPYCGWELFVGLIAEYLGPLFRSNNDYSEISRIGLRYTNTLTSSDHGLDSLFDLKLKVSVSGKEINAPINLTYLSEYSDTHTGNCRIVSREFLQGNFPTETTAVIDIDIFSQNTDEINDFNSAMNWFESAHEYEKGEFFSILNEDTLSQMQGEGK